MKWFINGSCHGTLPARENQVYKQTVDSVTEFHRSLVEYRPTPLVQVTNSMINSMVGEVFIKDESRRMGCHSFKALGASYSMFRAMEREWRSTQRDAFPYDRLFDSDTLTGEGLLHFRAASDGNHGRAVAWFASKLHQTATIYLPEATDGDVMAAIASLGAEICLVPGTYDDCVEQCRLETNVYGGIEISDTAYNSGMPVPWDVLMGYTTLFHELDELGVPVFDTVFVPVGVGGLAAAAVLGLRNSRRQHAVRIVTVEPESSDCLFASLSSGDSADSSGKQDSHMAGLNCGRLSVVAWPLLKEQVNVALAISDQKLSLARRLTSEQGIQTTATGSASLAGLLTLLDHPDNTSLLQACGIPGARLLLLNTEGPY